MVQQLHCLLKCRRGLYFDKSYFCDQYRLTSGRSSTGSLDINTRRGGTSNFKVAARLHGG